MRNAFAAAITDLAAIDSRLVLLSGDIGNRLFDRFKERFPDRFINCGIAEANMTGIGAGLGMCGMRPWIYTIAPFATTRVLEQIRVDICYHNVPVTVVGTGSGLSYASLGPTHHSLEDIAILRTLPNMTIVCPADAAEVAPALGAVSKLGGPAYVRLGKKGEPIVHRSSPKFEIGTWVVMRPGADVCLLGVGNMVAVALDAAEKLAAEGVSAQVVSAHTVKPLDKQMLMNCFRQFVTVAAVEEHGRIGGFGGAVAEWLAAQRWRTAPFIQFGTPDAFLCRSGGQTFARKQCGLSDLEISQEILTLYRDTIRV